MTPTPAKDYLLSVLDGDEWVIPDTEEEAIEMLISSHRRQWEIIHEMPSSRASFWRRFLTRIRRWFQ